MKHSVTGSLLWKIVCICIVTSLSHCQDPTSENDVQDLRSIGENFGFSVLDTLLQTSRDQFYHQQLFNTIAQLEQTNPPMAALLKSLPPDIVVSSLEEASQTPPPTGNHFIDILGRNGIVLSARNASDVGVADVVSGLLTNVWDLNSGKVQNSILRTGPSFPAVESTNPHDPTANRLVVPGSDQPRDFRSILFRKLAQRQAELQAAAGPVSPPNPFSVPLSAISSERKPPNPFTRSKISSEHVIKSSEALAGEQRSEVIAANEPPSSREATVIDIPTTLEFETFTTPAFQPTTRRLRGVDRLRAINSRALKLLTNTNGGVDDRFVNNNNGETIFESANSAAAFPPPPSYELDENNSPQSQNSALSSQSQEQATSTSSSRESFLRRIKFRRHFYRSS